MDDLRVLLVLFTSFDDNIVVLEHCRPVVTLALGLIAQKPPFGVVPKFTFMDLFQDIGRFLFIKIMSAGTVERSSI